MIYIKTDMLEMPNSCDDCPLEAYGANGTYYCEIPGHGTIEHKANRPCWCPLVEKEDIK